MHPTNPELPAGPRHALILATTGYADPDLADLNAPAMDAADMTDVLGDAELGGFTVASVIDRTSDDIRRALGDFLSDRTARDTILLYISGHGILNARGELHFAAADSIHSRLGFTAIEASWLRDRLDDCAARRQILILDCCFSGSFPGTKAPGANDLERRLIGSGRGRDLLAASRPSEFSYQREPVDGVSRSVFTAALVDGIRSGAADSDRDGVITVEEAYHYAADVLRGSDATQHPQISRSGGEGRLMLARSPRGVAVSSAAIPEALRVGLNSQYPNVRIGAATELGGWLTSSDRARVLAARTTLTAIADRDSPAVASVARKILEAGGRIRAAAPTRCSLIIPTVKQKGVKYISALSVSNGGALIAAGAPDKTLRVWDGSTGRLRCAIADVADYDLAMTISPDGRMLASGGRDTSIQLWETDGGRLLRTLPGHTERVHRLAFSPDGSLLVSNSHSEHTIRLWNVETGEMLHAWHGYTGGLGRQPFTPDGRLLVASSDESNVSVWDVSSGRLAHILEGPDPSFTAPVLSSDGKRLAVATTRHGAQFWDLTTMRLMHTFNGHTNFVTAVAISHDGSRLATGSKDLTGRVWNTTTGQLEHVLAIAIRKFPVGPSTVVFGHVDSLTEVAFPANGRSVLTVGDKTVRVWDIATGDQTLELTGHTGNIRHAIYLADRGTLITAGSDNTVRVWD